MRLPYLKHSVNLTPLMKVKGNDFNMENKILFTFFFLKRFIYFVRMYALLLKLKKNLK